MKLLTFQPDPDLGEVFLEVRFFVSDERAYFDGRTMRLDRNGFELSAEEIAAVKSWCFETMDGGWRFGTSPVRGIVSGEIDPPAPPLETPRLSVVR